MALAPEAIAGILVNAEILTKNFPADYRILLAEMADTILPDTDSPGAKAAKTEEFIILSVDNCMTLPRRKRFLDDLLAADERCLREQGASFVNCSAEKRIDFFKKLEAENTADLDPEFPPFFKVLKTLTLYGYFTSEIGATQALNYDPVPGVWEADLKIDASTKAWASVF